jgi:hypothetical protein
MTNPKPHRNWRAKPVSEQTGHGIRTLERHYAKYLPQDDDLTLPAEKPAADSADQQPQQERASGE